MRTYALLALLPYLALVTAAPAERPAYLGKGSHPLAKRACPAKEASSSTTAGVPATSLTSDVAAATASVSDIAAVAVGGGNGGGSGRGSHTWGGAGGTRTASGAVEVPTTTAADPVVPTTEDGTMSILPVTDIKPVETASEVDSATATGGAGATDAATATFVGTLPTTTAGADPAVTSADPAVTSAVTSAAAATTSASTGGNTGAGSTGGVGLAVDSSGWQALSNLPGLDWYWNWNIVPFDVAGVEFVPCVWGKAMVEQVAGATFPAGSTHIMSFNEPDQGSNVGGSDIDAAEAATLHQQWTTALTADLKIGSPAVARGGTTWFNNWLTACAGSCKYDFVPIHFYGTSAPDLITYIKEFPADGKPIWVTEFDCQDFSTGYVCTADEVNEFMTTAIEWFRGEGASYVERWSWFGAFPGMSTATNGLEAADASMNALGTAYLAL
ncbi:hypothetical protein IAT38_006833 [Cryptococcus sp. DSM 104549]